MYRFKIPYRCLPLIVQKPELLRAYCIYGKIKCIISKSKLPYWKDYKNTKSKHKLAAILGVSPNTLRKYIAVLKANDLVWESNRNLRLAHSYKIYEVFNLTPNVSEFSGKISTKNIRLSYEEITPENLITEVIKLKKNQIEYKQKQNIKEILLKEVGQIHADQIKKKIGKSINEKVNKIYNKYSEDTDYNFKQSFRKYGFLDNNVSLTTLAKMIGRKSKSTSLRWVNKLTLKNLINVERRFLVLYSNVEYNPMILSQINESLGKITIYKNNSVLLGLPLGISIV